jgi:hypothetical protein
VEKSFMVWKTPGAVKARQRCRILAAPGPTAFFYFPEQHKRQSVLGLAVKTGMVRHFY